MIKLIISLFLLLSSTRIFAQGCNSVKDTYYEFFIQYNLENGRPVNSFFLLKDIKTLPSFQSFKTQKEVICWFYQNAIVYREQLSTSDYDSCYFFKNDLEKKKFRESYFIKYRKESKSFYFISSRKFDDVKNSITVKCLKLNGDFWISPNEDVISDQIYTTICPHIQKELDLKCIYEIYKLDEIEKSILIKKVTQ